MSNRVSPFLLILVLIYSSLSVSSEKSPALLKGTAYSSQYGAVATVHPLATQVAAQQLEEGGNAVDAAIAAALVLGVVDSYNSGIGGGLFALVHWADGRIEAVDAREMASRKAHRDMYVREGKVQPLLSREGALAIGIPGSVAAFEYLSLRGGKKPLSGLYQQAANIAEQGFILSPSYVKRLASTTTSLKRFPESAAIFLDAQLKPKQVGDRLKQIDLAHTYRQLALKGSRYFYQGEFAKAMSLWMSENGGIIDEKDFADYQLRHRQAIHSQFLDYDIYGFPPPSSGGVHVAEILNILQQLDFKKETTEQRQHLMVEAMKLAFADRAHWLGDPDFVRVPKGLTDIDYAKALAKKIHPKTASNVNTYSTPEDLSQSFLDKHTTHISVADAQGNWVSLTTTLNTSFGSKVVIPGTGVLMNNQMDDFSAQPSVPNAYGLIGSEANSIEPKKRPLSSMSPTIVVKNKQPIMAVGAAGGPMIITQVTQALIRYLGFNESLYQSLASPRIHQQWRPDKVFFDKTLPVAQQQALEARGHSLTKLRFEGSTNAVSQKNTRFDAVSEPRLLERNQALLP